MRPMTPEQRQRAEFLAPIYRRLLEIAAEQRAEAQKAGSPDDRLAIVATRETSSNGAINERPTSTQ